MVNNTNTVFMKTGGALLWTAQGNFLSVNSDNDTVDRNSGIFWAIFVSSNFIGNLFVYFQFQGKEDIDGETRNLVGIVLLCVASAGTLLMFILRPTPWVDGEGQVRKSPLEALKASARLFITQDMLLLSVTFFYAGIHLSIYSAVYGTSVGFTNAFGKDRKALTTISSIFIGLGEVLGGAVFGIFGSKTVKHGRKPIVILGCIISLMAYFFAFLNLPHESPLRETEPFETAILVSDKYLTVFIGFLLGLSDACLKTQLYAFLGSTYKDDSSSAFAIYKFTECLAASLVFWYSRLVGLYWQLLVAAVCSVAGTFCFAAVEWRQSKRLEISPTEMEETGKFLKDAPE